MTGNHSAAVLRNKGVCVTINETIQAEDGTWEVARNDKGDAVRAKAWVKFDGNSLADLEAAFGDLERFQEASKTVPFTTVRRTLAIVFGWDDLHAPDQASCAGCRRVGLAMVEGSAPEYNSAVGVAMSLANGLDPTKAVLLVEHNARAVKEAMALQGAALDEMLVASQGESTSPVGSPNGSEPVAATTSSGG